MNELIEFCLDTENPNKNYALGSWYEKQGHTAAAHTYYLRCAERASDTNVDKNLAYSALIRSAICYKSQGSRKKTELTLLKHSMMLLPKRPESYYFLSVFYWEREDWENAYMYSNLGLYFCDHNFKNEYIPEYHGKYLLILQKALSSWWWGKGMESRELFKILLDDYWDEMTDENKLCVENNLTRLGVGPMSVSHTRYEKFNYEKLRFKFNESNLIERNFSQAYQDMFVLSMLNGKKNGTFLEIGGARPFLGNNTALLEKNYDWVGVSIEYDKKFIEEYRHHRSAKILHVDALQIDYNKLLDENFETTNIDYLQLDIEPARNTYECMLKIPFDKYKFAVITYEHDHYVDVTRKCRQESREYLRSKGYVLAVKDVSVDGKSSFEDWWVYPDLVDEKILNIMTNLSEDVTKIDDFMLSTKGKDYIKFASSEITFNISKKTNSTSWVVDNFYENPDKVRKFALKQEYIEGGFGRGFIGRRTEKQFLFPGLKEKFEEIMSKKITNWENLDMNGRFQNCHSGEPLVYHCDTQTWGGMIYLTPNAPYQCGTTLYAHKKTRARNYYEEGWESSWVDVPGDPHLDRTPFEPVDVFGNVYNRLVIFDASCIHSASEYFGTVMENSRLWQMFFFDTE